MEKTIVRYVTGLSDTASAWEKRQNKRYGNLPSVCRQIDYDIKHGATIEEVMSFLQKIQRDSSFSELRKKDHSVERLGELTNYFAPSAKKLVAYW